MICDCGHNLEFHLARKQCFYETVSGGMLYVCSCEEYDGEYDSEES
ncbi:hypothetical protein LCGC14_1853260 [marine sediment metagenome]|uniref:Uncharacterized protein n=1 Tax=marine sediment metagenome TaxID=412755 RepID=A0A0F9GXZ9_9ZZZZ